MKGERKKCRKCQRVKPLSEFSTYLRGGQPRVEARCKPCLKEAKALEYQRQLEKRRAARKEAAKWLRVDDRPFPVSRYPAWLCPGANG